MKYKIKIHGSIPVMLEAALQDVQRIIRNRRAIFTRIKIALYLLYPCAAFLCIAGMLTYNKLSSVDIGSVICILSSAAIVAICSAGIVLCNNTINNLDHVQSDLAGKYYVGSLIENSTDKFVKQALKRLAEVELLSKSFSNLDDAKMIIDIKCKTESDVLVDYINSTGIKKQEVLHDVVFMHSIGQEDDLVLMLSVCSTGNYYVYYVEAIKSNECGGVGYL